MTKRVFFWTTAILAALCAAIPAWGAEESVVASRFGYDPQDATEALQSAIDSGAKRVVIDRQDSPWILRPIRLRGNLELILEEGVELLAKKGEFRELGDVFFVARNAENLKICGEGKGATLRMRKTDYWQEPYQKSEWRHGLSFLSCENVLVENLQIAETGGDGIYLGVSSSESGPCKNVTIRNVDCKGNNRQGISVISVDGLTIEDCVLRETVGTAPEAGIDFEPNRSNEQITNVVMRRVKALNNAGDGIVFYLPNLSESSRELSFTIEDCVCARNRGRGFGLTVANGKGDKSCALDGALKIKNLDLLGNRLGIEIRSKWSDGAFLSIDGLTLTTPDADRESGRMGYSDGGALLWDDIDAWTREKDYPGITFIAVGSDVAANGGVKFERAQIIDARDKINPDVPLFKLRDASADGVGFRDITGSLETRTLDGELVATTSLTPETFARLFPGEAARYVKRVPLDATFLTSSEGETLAQAWHDRAVDATPLRLRGSARYFVWLDEGEEGVLFLRQHKIGSYPPLPVEVAATEPDGSRVEYEPKVAVDAPLEVKLPKGTKGWRIVDAEFGPSFVTLEKSEGIVLTSAAPKADVFGSTGTFDFYVPETSEELSLRVVGSVAERVTARLYDPDGEEVSTLNDVDSLAVWTSPLDATGNPVKPKPGFWRVSFERPTEGTLEDYIFSIRGAPALLK